MTASLQATPFLLAVSLHACAVHICCVADVCCACVQYGVVVLWGLSCTQEAALLATVTKHCSFTVLSHIEQQVGQAPGMHACHHAYVYQPVG